MILDISFVLFSLQPAKCLSVFGSFFFPQCVIHVCVSVSLHVISTPEGAHMCDEKVFTLAVNAI